MANRAYLYSLSNRPTAYADRPDAITGLSEWAYDIPFSYRLLMSGDPQVCASLISDGLEDESSDAKTPLYAISSHFDTGLARLERFAAIVRTVVLAPSPATPMPSFWGRLFGRAGGAAAQPAAPASYLVAQLDESLAFLRAHRNPYLLLETVELDLMSVADAAGLRACVDAELARCQQAGAALDALDPDPAIAAAQLRQAVAQTLAPPLDAFHGLRLDDDCDNVRDEKTAYPLGLEWSDVLYFDLDDKLAFEARQQG